MAHVPFDDLIRRTSELRQEAFNKMIATPAGSAWVTLDRAVKDLEAANRGVVRPADVFRNADPVNAVNGWIAAGRNLGRRISQADAAAVVLHKRNDAMTIAELVPAIIEEGAAVGGENPEINVSSTLSRDRRFRSVRVDGKSMWWLADVPLPHETNEAASPDLLAGPAASSVSSKQEGGEVLAATKLNPLLD